jgi:DNA-binding NtrC family response regulator
VGRTAERLKVTRHALRYRMQRLNMKADPETSGAGRESETN